VPIQAATRFKAWVYGHSLGGIMDLTLAGVLDVCLLCYSVLSDIGFSDRPIPCPQLSCHICMIVIRRKSNPPHLE
jgi:hypothetical protein